MKPNEKRIFRTLQQVQGKGIEELGLLGDSVSGAYARKIRSRLNIALGDKRGVYVDLGVWYLSKEYWDMPMVDIKDLFLLQEIKSMKKVVGLSALTSIISISAIVVLLILIIIS